MRLGIFFSCICLLFLTSINCKASTLILEEIQKSIINDFKLEGKIKIVKDTPPDSIKISPKAEPKKELSKGELAVQEQLRQNREKVKQYQQQNEDITPGNDLLKTKQQEITEWQRNKKQEIIDNQIKKQQEIKDWQNEKQLIINQWLTEKGNFNKRIPKYKENLISENVFLENQIQATNDVKNSNESQKTSVVSPEKMIPPNITMPIFPDFYVIDKSLDVEIKDQGQRPTCAAFTGIRAMEILMSQQGKDEKLSEQYFFWASIPKCQTSPCQKEGSWVFNAYQSSLEAKSPNIPLEKDCPYNQKNLNDNVTQIPLNNSCLTGHAKIKKFTSVQTSAEIITAIKAGHPVIGGFKLTENFYKNEGYVFVQSTKDGGAKLDEHAGGHAVLLVGIMKMPAELHQKEGKFCLISANSWGPGWGKGGHACLSENWIERHRFNVPFIALEQVETI
ncbi:MAG: C1 family peptidase [Bacteriovorax sp.]|nr:C1 family peptidase [Bacteriovorax sp.]